MVGKSRRAPTAGIPAAGIPANRAKVDGRERGAVHDVQGAGESSERWRAASWGEQRVGRGEQRVGESSERVRATSRCEQPAGASSVTLLARTGASSSDGSQACGSKRIR